jgi:cardiolipin synthase
MLTIPNAITLLRALGVPAFLYFFLVADQPLLSFFIIMFGGLTDYFDGKVARALNQSSDFGAKFDPTVDRLYISAIVIALAVKDYLPWALVIALLLRDLILLLLVIVQKVRKLPYAEVSYLGKAATFNLLYAFPILLLDQVEVIARYTNAIGWAFAIWGLALYFYTGFQYLISGIKGLRRVGK